MRTINVTPIEVEYIDHMGDDKRIANVARVSFAKWDESDFTDKDANLLDYLATGLPKADRSDWEKVAKAHTHFTPFCHAFLTIRVKVPAFCARQLHKHVVGLVINEESRRYITNDVELFVPDILHKAPAHAKQGASNEAHTHLVNPTEIAKELVLRQSKESVEAYYELLDAGVAPEEARMVLPLNTQVSWIWSGSLLAFNRVYQLRSDSHAQITATQEFANKLGKILYEKFPNAMKALNYGEQQ